MVQPMDYQHKSGGPSGWTMLNFHDRLVPGGMLLGSAAGRLTCGAILFTGDEPLSVARFGIYLSANGAGQSAHLGLYNVTSKDNIYPSTLVHDAGIVSLASGAPNAMYFPNGNITLPAASAFWFVTNFAAGTGTVFGQYNGSSTDIINGNPLGATIKTGSPTYGGGAMYFGWSTASGFGSMPSSFPGLSPLVTLYDNTLFPAIIIDPA